MFKPKNGKTLVNKKGNWMKTLLLVSDYAAIQNLSKKHVYSLIKKEDIVSIKLDKKLYVVSNSNTPTAQVNTNKYKIFISILSLILFSTLYFSYLEIENYKNISLQLQDRNKKLVSKNEILESKNNILQKEKTNCLTESQMVEIHNELNK